MKALLIPSLALALFCGCGSLAEHKASWRSRYASTPGYESAARFLELYAHDIGYFWRSEHHLDHCESWYGKYGVVDMTVKEVNDLLAVPGMSTGVIVKDSVRFTIATECIGGQEVVTVEVAKRLPRTVDAAGGR